MKECPHFRFIAVFADPHEIARLQLQLFAKGTFGRTAPTRRDFPNNRTIDKPRGYVF